MRSPAAIVRLGWAGVNGGGGPPWVGADCLCRASQGRNRDKASGVSDFMDLGEA